MKNRKLRLIPALLAALLLLVPRADAARSGMVWASVTRGPAGTGTEVLILTDTPVTDGVICVNYDPDLLTYSALFTEGECVAQYAVNAREPGKILISWVGPAESGGEGAVAVLFRLCFEGLCTGDQVQLSGAVHDALGAEVPLGFPDSSALLEALASAAQLAQPDYTPESWEVLRAAVETGESILRDPRAGQGALDAAAGEIRAAMDALVLRPEQADTGALREAVARAEEILPRDWTDESYHKLLAALDRARQILQEENPAQDAVDTALAALTEALDGLEPAPTEKPAPDAPAPPGDNPETGDEGKPGLAILAGAVSLAGMGLTGALLLVQKRKERGGK